MCEQPDESKTIRSKLIAAMRDGQYANCQRLPAENILAESLGISRTQLRDVLATLEREGFITRRHGVGTVINHHVLDVPTRMDIEVEFLDMIRQSGGEPAVAYVRVMDLPADGEIARRLKIPQGAPVVRVARLVTSDGVPAIYCEDVVDKARVHGAAALGDYKLPFFHFLRKFCGAEAYMDLTEIHPTKADAFLAEVFRVPMGTPLLFMDEVDYDVDGEPVFCSREYYVDGIIHHTVLRKKL